MAYFIRKYPAYKLTDIWELPAVTFFILMRASQKIDILEDEKLLMVSSYPHMDEKGHERINRHYERLHEYVLEEVPDDEDEINKLKALQDG